MYIYIYIYTYIYIYIIYIIYIVIHKELTKLVNVHECITVFNMLIIVISYPSSTIIKICYINYRLQIIF